MISSYAESYQVTIPQNLNHDVHMIRHHNPGNEPVPFAIKVKQSLFYQTGNARITQITGTIPGIQIFFSADTFLHIVSFLR
jgi:hypothetical protein